MMEAVIVSAVRTPVGRSGKGAFATTRPDDLASVAVQEALKRVPGSNGQIIDSKEIEDLILGCAMPEGEQGWNMARTVVLRAVLPVEIGGLTVNRLCASGLEAIAQAANQIQSGRATGVVAGGAESMSMIPMGGAKPSPNPWLAENYPQALLTMGLTAERVARRYNISREDQDAFALASHEKAQAAQVAGRFSEIVPVTVRTVSPGDNSGKPKTVEIIVDMDEGPRADTSLAALAKLKPAFHAQGSVTAGNSSQTSAGAAATIVMSAERARQLGIQPLARFAAFATAGTLPEEMGVGPVYAIPKALRLSGLTLEDIDLIELNEAFAAQALAVLRQLGLPDDAEHVNPHGGGIALGHPLGMSGARLALTAVNALEARGTRRAVVTMCIGVGQGIAALIEKA